MILHTLWDPGAGHVQTSAGFHSGSQLCPSLVLAAPSHKRSKPDSTLWTEDPKTVHPKLLQPKP